MTKQKRHTRISKKGKPFAAGTRKDNPQPLSRIEELMRLKKQELAEKTPEIKPLNLPPIPKKEESDYEKKIPGINRSKKEILYFEIGTECGACGYPVGPDWTLEEDYIICPKCKHKKERSSWSKGK